MATKSDLMGLSMSHMLADRMGFTPVIATAVGATIGSATQIGGVQFLTFVNTGTSGLKLPQVTGDEQGALLGDEFNIFNATSAAIVIYANNTAAGSAVTIFGQAASVAGTTGVSIPTGQLMTMFPVTVSTWVMVRGSA